MANLRPHPTASGVGYGLEKPVYEEIVSTIQQSLMNFLMIPPFSKSWGCLVVFLIICYHAFVVLLANIRMANDGNEGAGAYSLSLEELIASTVRALSLREADRVSQKEMETLIPQFDGAAGEDVNMWFDRIEKVKNRFSVTNDRLLLVIISKLSGRALDWFHSKPEHVNFDFDKIR